MKKHNLPAQVALFVGREQEIADISALLHDSNCRLLTLCGPGGSGKTRLAVEVACLITDENAPLVAFSHGAYFVPLQPLTSTSFIVPAIANSLQFKFNDKRDPREQLLDFLSSRQLLLVMDNFEHLLDGADLLPDILEQAPAVKILVTSRERLRLREEWVLDIHGLPYPGQDDNEATENFTAMQLFIECARQSGYMPQDTDAKAISHICRLVEGIPLAIELASAWARILPCDTIAIEIEHGLDILTTNLRNVPEKHRSMRAVFEHSWKLLSKDEQSVFRKLSVFHGGFRREAATAVAGANLRILAALVDRSLLRVDADERYSLQELLRQYAHYQLGHAHEAETVSDDHCAYYAEFMAARAPILKGVDQIQALDEIETDINNVRVSWRWAVAHGKQREVGQISDALFQFYMFRNHYQEGSEAFELAVARFGDEENLFLAQLLLALATFSGWRANLDRSNYCRQKGMAILQQPGTPSITMSRPLWILVPEPQELGGYEVIYQFFEGYRIECRRRSDAWGVAWSHKCQGNLAMLAMQAEQARRCFLDAAAGFQALGDKWAYSSSVAGLAITNEALKRYEEARPYRMEHLALCRAANDRGGILNSLVHLAKVAYVLGELKAFRQYIDEALSLLFEIKNWSEAYSIACLTGYYLMDIQGQSEQAVELLAVGRTFYTVMVIENEIGTRLDALKAELPLEVFMAAKRRGQARDPKALAFRLQEIFSTLNAAETHAELPVQPLVDVLTDRELEVLTLIVEGYTNRGIADQLYISVNTVKKHVNHIFSKLDVTSRGQAIAQTRRLRILS